MVPTSATTSLTAHPLKEHRIPEVGERRRAALERGGWDTLEALAAAEPAQLTTVSGIHQGLAERIVARARERLRELSDGDLMSQSPATEPEGIPENGAAPDAAPVVAHRVRTGRRVRRVMARLDEAAEHAAQAKKGQGRKGTRAALLELKAGLSGLRSRLRQGAVPDEEWRRARRVLQRLEERLDQFLARRPKRSRLLKIRQQAEQATASLVGDDASR